MCRTGLSAGHQGHLPEPAEVLPIQEGRGGTAPANLQGPSRASVHQAPLGSAPHVEPAEMLSLAKGTPRLLQITRATSEAPGPGAETELCV